MLYLLEHVDCFETPGWPGACRDQTVPDGKDSVSVRAYPRRQALGA